MSDQLKPTPSGAPKPQQPGTTVRIGQGFQKALQGVSGEMSLPRLFHQLVIFLLDGSGSMTKNGRTGSSKGKELHDSMVAVLGRLKESKNRHCFDITCRVFSDDASILMEQIPVVDIDLTDTSFDPTHHVEARRTYVCAALESAIAEAQEYLQRKATVQSQVLIILFTDGDFHDKEDAMVLSEDARGIDRLTLSTIFYETELTPEWEERFGTSYNEDCADVLRGMASEEEYFASTIDPDAVRGHMIKSISKVSKL